MCFELDSLPPIPAISGAAVSHDDLVLEAADGAPLRRLRGHARTSRPASASSCSRTCAASTTSTRSSRCASPSVGIRRSRSTTSAAPPASAKRDDDFEYMPHVRRRRRRASRPTSRPPSPYLRSPAGGARRCSRSASASVAATRGSPRRRATVLRARSASTARRAGATGTPGPTQRRRDGGADPRPDGRGRREHPGRRQSRAFDAALTAAGVEHEIVTYDGAPHSFFDRSYEEFADASADAWSRVVAFIEQHGG